MVWNIMREQRKRERSEAGLAFETGRTDCAAFSAAMWPNFEGFAAFSAAKGSNYSKPEKLLPKHIFFKLNY